jgi:hypothetical protein
MAGIEGFSTELGKTKPKRLAEIEADCLGESPKIAEIAEKFNIAEGAVCAAVGVKLKGIRDHNFEENINKTNITRLGEIAAACHDSGGAESSVESEKRQGMTDEQVCLAVRDELVNRRGELIKNDFLRDLDDTSQERLNEIIGVCTLSAFTNSSVDNGNYNMTDAEVCAAVAIKGITDAIGNNGRH